MVRHSGMVGPHCWYWPRSGPQCMAACACSGRGDIPSCRLAAELTYHAAIPLAGQQLCGFTMQVYNAETQRTHPALCLQVSTAHPALAVRQHSQRNLKGAIKYICSILLISTRYQSAGEVPNKQHALIQAGKKPQQETTHQRAQP